ncbi:hypothetical protein B0T09DRAFT_163422 [Sordaria sp. MPI-SDFR-AT-0083]|nr:hypothetical protein B0T09DRAFT_163422 [Sordaria sp. MPI-SDFR-AT-0083]
MVSSSPQAINCLRLTLTSCFSLAEPSPGPYEPQVRTFLQLPVATWEGPFQSILGNEGAGIQEDGTKVCVRKGAGERFGRITREDFKNQFS